MGAGQSDLYKGTYGDNAENIPDFLKGDIKLPQNDSQLKHIFRKTEGHLIDTDENRQLAIDLANDKRTYIGQDYRKIHWNARINDDGSQDWVCYRDGIIQDAGRNTVPRGFDEITGLKHNVQKDSSWRKRK